MFDKIDKDVLKEFMNAQKHLDPEEQKAYEKLMKTKRVKNKKSEFAKEEDND